MTESQKAFERHIYKATGAKKEDFDIVEYYLEKLEGEYKNKEIQELWNVWQAATQWADS